MNQLRLKPFEAYEKVPAYDQLVGFIVAQVERGTVALGSKTVGSSAFWEDQRAARAWGYVAGLPL